MLRRLFVIKNPVTVVAGCFKDLDITLPPWVFPGVAAVRWTGHFAATAALAVRVKLIGLENLRLHSG
jgi:hypothetical protein